MAKSFINLVLGNQEEKRTYRKFMKRVNALPKQYRYAFKKMRHYLYYSNLTGCETLFIDLVELLEVSAAEGKPVLEVVGTDVAAFCDELVCASEPNLLTPGEKLNKEVLEHLQKGGI